MRTLAAAPCPATAAIRCEGNRAVRCPVPVRQCGFPPRRSRPAGQPEKGGVLCGRNSTLPMPACALSPARNARYQRTAAICGAVRFGKGARQAVFGPWNRAKALCGDRMRPAALLPACNEPRGSGGARVQAASPLMQSYRLGRTVTGRMQSRCGIIRSAGAGQSQRRRVCPGRSPYPRHRVLLARGLISYRCRLGSCR